MYCKQVELYSYSVLPEADCFWLRMFSVDSDLCAGLIGGLGVTPSGNIGQDGAIFESVSKSGEKK